MSGGVPREPFGFLELRVASKEKQGSLLQKPRSSPHRDALGL